MNRIITAISRLSLLAVISVPAIAADNPRILLTTTLGNITLELDAVNAPKSTENFVRYVRDGHYDGTIFHRVIKNFMIQGGGFDAKYQQKDTRDSIPNEADNGLKNTQGTVAMARTGDPHSATSQFFINVVDNAFLDHRSKTRSGWGYTVFGKVVNGMDIVEKIRELATGSAGPFRSDVPLQSVAIETATIIEPMAAEASK